jgi:polysaccharide export outer membrane protein
MEGKAAPFFLKSGDIVYVPQTGISSWNQTLQLILPSLQTISAVLNPFVSIKYLTH